MKRARGFTLLELLVALTIFAILSAMAYGGLNSVLSVRRETERQAERLRAVQMAVNYLARDLIALAPRDVRDEYGDTQAALLGGSTDGRTLELTRAGWRNPVGHARSTLQRVSYGLDEEVLVRRHWRELDRAQDSKAQSLRLLSGVRSFSVRFLDNKRQWAETWPPSIQTSPGEPPPPTPLPLAVEVTLELTDFGTITRLVRTNGF